MALGDEMRDLKVMALALHQKAVLSHRRHQRHHLKSAMAEMRVSVCVCTIPKCVGIV